MALPVNRPLQEWNLDVHLADITTSGATADAYVPCPFRGRLVRVYASQYVHASGGACVISTAINGTAISGASMTFAVTTGLPGFVYSATPTDSSVTHFNEGDVIRFRSSGAATDGTVPATFTAVVRRV
jgi:hypothetical protein